MVTKYIDRTQFPVTPAGQLNDTSEAPGAFQMRFVDVVCVALSVATTDG